MKETIKEFDSKKEAEAFVSGIDFANDSALSATLVPDTRLIRFPSKGSWKVKIEDKDGEL